MYLAIEGIKGSGKSTVFSEVFRQLVSRGYQPARLEPTTARRDSLVDRAYDLLGNFCPNPVIERVYAYRSNRAAREVSRRARLILGQRSILTSYVTRWNYEDPEAGLRHVDALENRIAIPDHVIFLAIPPESAAERIKMREKRTYGIGDQSLRRLREANHLYRHLMWQASRYSLEKITWHNVDATQRLDDVVFATRSLVEDIFLSDFQPATAIFKKCIDATVATTKGKSQ